MTHEGSALCPLCASAAVELVETLPRPRVNELYAKGYGVEDAVSRSLSYLKCNCCHLGFFSPAEAGGEDLYERLQGFDWYYMADKWEYAEALKFIGPEDAVLEVGSGRAAFATYIGKDRYTGLEFNLQAINRAKRAGVHLIKEPVDAHASHGYSYDVVVSFQVLEHVSDPAGFLRGCIDCLRPGGKLIVAVPADDGFVGRAVNDTLNMPPHHVTRWPDATLEKVASLFGLELQTLVQEPVAAIHSEWAGKVQYETRMRDALGMAPRALDRSLAARIVSRVAAFLSAHFPTALTDQRGHTVLAVYRKNS